MTPFGGAITPIGALVNVRVCRPDGTSYEGPAIIDTGSYLNFVAAHLVPPDLPVIDEKTGRGLGGAHATFRAYELSIVFPDCKPPILMPIRLGERPVPSNYLYSSPDLQPPIIALLGRDILSNFHMTWDGHNGLVMLTPNPQDDLGARGVVGATG